MFKSFLKIGFRSLMKNKLVTFINLFGLGLSMSVGLMIMTRVKDQLSYDNFHPASANTYRIITDFSNGRGETWELASTPVPLSSVLEKGKGDQKTVVNIYPALNGEATVDGRELNIYGAYTQPSFFEVFGFRLEQGDESRALQQPNSIVLTHDAALKFFGKTKAIGKVITIDKLGNYQVTGVLEVPPSKTHLPYEAYASSATVPALEKSGVLLPREKDFYALDASYTYVRLGPQASSAALRNELTAIARDQNHKEKSVTVGFHVQRLDKITPGTEQLQNEISSGTGWSKLAFEVFIALLILFAGAFNYTNLTIARALTRAREVGVRKISGALRSQVFLQYIIESVILSFLALIFAWFIMLIVLRYAPFNDGYEFIPSSTKIDAPLMISSILFALLTGLISGVAPASILSAFKPVRVLKNLATAKVFGKVNLQKTLIVFQYSLSLIIIIFLSAFYRQFSFMNHADPGFKKDNVAVVNVRGSNVEIAKQEFGSISGIQKVAALSSEIGLRFGGGSCQAKPLSGDNQISLNYFFTDANFIPSMDIALISGQNFFQGSADSLNNYIILNRKAVDELHLGNAVSAVGQQLILEDSLRYTILGVTKNFHYENTGRPIRPLAFRLRPEEANIIYLTTNTNVDKRSILARVDNVSSTLFEGSEHSISATWLSDDLNIANSQNATVSLLGYLAFIAVSVATLGLLGLVVYSIEVRKKEISIRKIIGARELDLVKMLSMKFVKLIFIAGLIAVPIGYVAGVLFLQNFSIRVNFGLQHALICFLLLLTIALSTIGSQTYKASTANPADHLRSE